MKFKKCLAARSSFQRIHLVCVLSAIGFGILTHTSIPTFASEPMASDTDLGRDQEIKPHGHAGEQTPPPGEDESLAPKQMREAIEELKTSTSGASPAPASPVKAKVTANSPAPVQAQASTKTSATAAAQSKKPPSKPQAKFPTYPLVIMYHEVVQHYDPKRQAPSDISVEDFKKQIKILKKNHYQTISGQELLDAIQGEHGASLKSLPERAVLLTFDDGYAGNYENAVPVLRDPEYAMNAVFFINPFTIENENVWNKHMDWDEIREIDMDPNFMIGSHTYQHLKLDLIQGKELEFEFSEASKILYEKLGHGCKLMAYPFGRHNRETVKVAARFHDVGFVVGTAQRNYISQFQIPRLSISNRLSLQGFERAIKNYALNPKAYPLK